MLGLSVNDMQYSYDGNRTSALTDKNKFYPDYAYDTNGNMIKDGANGLQLKYNSLNLLSEARNAGRLTAKYRWLADGTKVSATTGDDAFGLSYLGSLIYKRSGSTLELESASFGGGRIEASEGSSGTVYTPNYFIADHLGSTRAVLKPTLDGFQVAERNHYYPFGKRVDLSSSAISDNRFRFSGKEEQAAFSLPFHDFGARMYDNPRWTTFDPLAEARPWESPYLYCAGNPVNAIDPTGLAWRPTYYEENNQKTYTGYSWVPENESYNDNGQLKDGLYSQAIFFSDNGTFDESSNKNIGSSTAYVYLANGAIETFGASTYPSDQSKYATVPEGMYKAVVGTHAGSSSSYPALRMSDDGSYYGTIELGGPNPSDTNRTYAQGVNIHKPGRNNITGKPGGLTISAGCFLIDINNWDRFIRKFNNPAQKRNTVGIINSRTLPKPGGYEGISSYINRTR